MQFSKHPLLKPPVVVSVLLASILIYIGSQHARDLLPALEDHEWSTLRHFPPRSLPHLLEQRDVALRYAARNPVAVLFIWAAMYLGMQTFAIPGTLSLSLLAGALYGSLRGWLVVSLISTLGSSSCYLMSRLLGRPLVAAWWPEKLEFFAAEVQKRRSKLFNYIIFLRLTPILPNTFINVASPLVDVPLLPFFLGTLFGCMPNNWLACSAGSRLSDLCSLSDLFDWHTMALSAAAGSMVVLLPFWLGRRS